MRNHDINRPLGPSAQSATNRRRTRRGFADPEIEQWCVAAWQTALARMIRRRGLDEFDASEVAGDVVEQFLKKPAFWMERFPNPEKFANSVADSRLYDYLRRARRDRKEGANLLRNPDGSTRKREQVVPLVHQNPDTGEWEDLDPADRSRDFTETVAERVDLERAGIDLTLRQTEAVREVVVKGRTALEVGAEQGVGHTPIVKHRKRAEQILRENLGDDYLRGSS